MPPAGVMDMRLVEESLVSAGAISPDTNNPAQISAQDKPSLTETSPEKLTIEIRDIQTYPVKTLMVNLLFSFAVFFFSF